MSRLLSSLTLWLLLLVAAQPASGMMGVPPENRVWDFFAPEPVSLWEIPSSDQDGTREAEAYGYEFASDVCDGPNLYAYVLQNPWTKFDPDGLLAFQTHNPHSSWNPQIRAITSSSGYQKAYWDEASKGALAFVAAPVVAAAVYAGPVVVAKEVADEAFDQAFESITGVPAPPTSITDLGQKLLKEGGQKLAKEGIEKTAKDTVENASAKTGDSYVYGVIDTQTGTLTKPGMSSGPIPNRMNQSVKTADQRSGVADQHKGVIIDKGMTPEQARALEQKVTDKVEVRRPGTFPNKFHQRPTPKVETKEQFKEKYGHEHNK